MFASCAGFISCCGSNINDSSGSGIVSSYQHLINPGILKSCRVPDIAASASSDIAEPVRTRSLQAPGLHFYNLDVVLGQTSAAARLQQQDYRDKRWNFTLGNRTGSLQDAEDKISYWLDRFKPMADIASNADLVHVGLPRARI